MSNTLTPESRGRLINLKTNLKSLRFGGDRPASGTSNQPYIVTDIPSGTGYLRDGMPLRSGPDFILRDGFLAPLKALKDVSRLAKMFIDTKSPRGLFFTLKENLLSRTNVKTQASFGAGYFGGAMNQGAYLPLGTLLQAGFNWAGAHLNKFGLNPVGSLGGPAGANRNARGGAGALNPYSVVVRNDQEIGDNRLYNFNNFVSKGTSTSDDFFGGAFDNLLGAKFNINPEATTENPDTPILYSYGGGPGSILGVGKTNIFKERPTYNAIRNYQNLSSAYPNYSGVQPSGLSTLLHGDSFRLYSNTELTTRRGLYPRSFMNFVIDSEVEFDDTTGNVVSKIIHKAPNYVRQNKSIRIGIGDPGQHITYAVDGINKERNLFDYSIPAFDMEALDKITALKMYEAEGPNHSLPINDLCKFRIAVVNNGPSEGKKATYLHFRAYINGFTDNYAATWNDVQYVGRGNVFKNYSGFTRDISMGFTIAATSKAELIPMFTKLNFLASSLTPDYNQAGFMRGNMVRMTVGGYLYEVPGVLTSLTYTIPDDTTWEIAIDTEGKSDPSVKELPHRIEVSLAFTPVEDFLPRRQRLLYNEEGELRAVGNETFISLNNGINNNYIGDNGLSKYAQPVKTQSDE
jgi:hypothetical protein